MWSFLRWSSTGGIGVCILAVARMGGGGEGGGRGGAGGGIAFAVSLRHTSTDHSLPYFNSGLSCCSSAGPPAGDLPIKALGFEKGLQCIQLHPYIFNKLILKCVNVVVQFHLCTDVFNMCVFKVLPL